MKKNTAWKETVWGGYQKSVILPNFLRLLSVKKGEVVLDLGCGTGSFSREFAATGAKVIGVDNSTVLIEAAKKISGASVEYRVASASHLSFIKSGSVDKIAAILTIQNLDYVDKVFRECARVLKAGGKMLVVLNHPAFRIPKASGWDWDSLQSIQYRRVDRYLSESKEKILMHPSTSSGQVPSTSSRLRQGYGGQAGQGLRPEEYTISFHRPLQFYFKLFHNSGFCVSRLEEWISNKKSEVGPRSKAEDIARKEIPLFLFLETIKI